MDAGDAHPPDSLGILIGGACCKYGPMSACKTQKCACCKEGCHCADYWRRGCANVSYPHSGSQDQKLDWEEGGIQKAAWRKGPVEVAWRAAPLSPDTIRKTLRR